MYPRFQHRKENLGPRSAVERADTTAVEAVHDSHGREMSFCVEVFKQ
jgi:hypothetical protein